MARSEIIRCLKPHCKKYGFGLNYIPVRDTYFLHLEGRAIMTFNSSQFYSVPKAAHDFQIRALLKSGLVNNLREPGLGEQLFMDRHMGKKLI